MPTLHWIGKEKVVNHHKDVPFKVLEFKYGFIADPANSTGHEQTEPTYNGNKIIHGDNLEALKSLLPEYEGRIKCIYIDPPYNTGNESWIYNDNVNDPKIKRWLDETLKNSEKDQVAARGLNNLTKHDKWLCMMYPRLKLLQQLLANDGAIFISIDDNELAYLKIIMDEIFEPENFIEYFSWVKTETPSNLSLKTKKTIEYIVCYQKSKNKIKFKGLKKHSKSSNGLMNQSNTAKELIFPPAIVDTSLKNGIYKKGSYGTKSYAIELIEDTEVLNGYFSKPIRLFGKFKWSQQNLDNEIKKGTKISIRTIAFSPSYEKAEYEPEVPWNLINTDFGVKTNEIASTELKNIFGKKVFDFPKPPSLIEYIINFLCDKNDIILDSFAGSGTTAHAVLNLNKNDGGNRKFILIEMEDYANEITAERIKRVSKGYGTGTKKVEGTGGKFDFYELGISLFDQNQNFNDQVSIDKMREYIWVLETRTAFKELNAHSYYLGLKDEKAYYFIYEIGHATSLNYDNFKHLNIKGKQNIIYADDCLLSQTFMSKKNIIFKKIPRDTSTFKTA
jgi:adenine-specific DNA-methyltransferase